MKFSIFSHSLISFLVFCVMFLFGDFLTAITCFGKIEMLCALSSPVTEATDGELKVLVGLMVECSCLEVAGCCLSTTRYEVCYLLGTTWVC